MTPRILFVPLLAAALTASAIPARRGTYTITQPDGSTVEVCVKGDERAHIYTTPEGMPLLEKNGFYSMASFDRDGNLVEMGTRAASGALSIPSETQISAYLTKKAQESVLGARQPMRQNSSVKRVIDPDCRGLFPGTLFPSKGEQKALIILFQFQDVRFTLDEPWDYFHDMLNKENFSESGGTGSAVDFFKQNSQGLFSPQFDVFGPVTVSKRSSYYADRSGVEKVWEAVIEACQTLDDEIDFSQYDRDGDGAIDNVYLFYAGKGQNAGGGSWTIWPHSWYITSATSTPYYFDGVQLDTYACSNEILEDNIPDGVGTFTHEFSHVLGLADLYATNYSSAFTPDEYDVMDGGPYNNDSRTPPNFSAFERFALDWIDPVELNSPASITLNPIASDNPQAYLITTETDNEYFIFENRQQSGWDAYIPGHGMLVWHIAYDADAWNDNAPNNETNKQRVDLVEADNMRTEGTRDADPFPGTKNITSLTDDTKPNTKSWAGKAQGRPITNITEVDGVICFDVMGGKSLPVPEALVASKITSNSAELTWDAVEEADHYLVSVFTLDGTKRSYLPGYNDCKADGTYLLVEGLAPETTYSWVVKAADEGIATSKESAVMSFTTEKAPLEDFVPTALAATDITDCSFTANWEKPTEVEALYYEVTVYTLEDGVETPISGSPWFVSNAEITMTTVGNLLPETTYYYYVIALDDTSASQKSNVISLTTEAGAALHTLDTDIAPAAYYNLQGMPIDAPAPGTIVIRRQGHTATKLLVK
ncbi:MAG: M6 family metalloprotease domain-containing protein [Muribaculaceae bacterium]|nr:M6 family metalloprotease domain-containing protein [Muribaculaceae bacterium]